MVGHLNDWPPNEILWMKDFILTNNFGDGRSPGERLAMQVFKLF